MRKTTLWLLVVACAAMAIALLGPHGGRWRAELRRLTGRTPAPAARPPVGDIFSIASHLYVVPRGGGNTAVFVTSSGVVLVDTKWPESWSSLIEQIRKVTDQPITHVVNTHFHDDHTGGNAFLPPGVDIVMHEATARNLASQEPFWRRWQSLRPPIRTYKDRLTLLAGDEAIDLYYFGRAHTDGDTFVVFRSAGVMHAGDVFPGRAPPIINVDWGGSGLEYGETIGRAVAAITGVTRVIPGHGPVFDWQEFVEYGEFNRLLLAHAQAAMTVGKSPRQAFEELKLPSKFSDYKMVRGQSTFEELYRSLKPWWRFW